MFDGNSSYTSSVDVITFVGTMAQVSIGKDWKEKPTKSILFESAKMEKCGVWRFIMVVKIRLSV